MLIDMFKTAATVCLGLVITSGIALGQQPKRQQQRQQQPRAPRPEKPPKPQKALKQAPIQNPELTVERMRRLLKLNDDQVFQLRTMVNNRNLEISRAYQDGGTSGSRKATLESIQQHFQSEVRTLLTPQQIDRFDRALLGRPGAFH